MLRFISLNPDAQRMGLIALYFHLSLEDIRKFSPLRISYYVNLLKWRKMI
jgi:hypothetical protein